jgi:serine-type D-Ala-D-Ala carboxypeptidase/endopeptidase (penicillin-binding protein 4)
MKSLLRLKLCFVLLFLSGCQTAALHHETKTIPPFVAKLLQDAGLPESALGIAMLPVAPQKNGAIGLSVNQERPMQPASTFKLLTSIVGLETLRPDVRARTQLLSKQAAAPILKQDLVLSGSGNPDFSSAAFAALLDKLRALGVQTIQGDLLIDRHWLTPARGDIGVPPFDETPEFAYNFVPDALSLNQNMTGIEISAGKDKIVATLKSALDGVQVISDMTLIDGLCRNWEDKWQTPIVRAPAAANESIQIVLKGEFPRDCQASTEVNVLDRTVFVDTVFRTLWREKGGKFDGRVRELDRVNSVQSDVAIKLAGYQVLATHESRPLSETIRDINKRSDNAITRLLYLSLGVVRANTMLVPPIGFVPESSTPTAAHSRLVVLDWLASKKIDTTGIVLENGSGLSRTERISAKQLAQVLVAAHSSRWAPEFLASLPIVGIDGSMRNRLKQSRAAQGARIKTGGLRDVSSVAGYVNDKHEQTWALVVFLNHPKAATKEARLVLDGLIDWVANY